MVLKKQKKHSLAIDSLQAGLKFAKLENIEERKAI
jgi:hypothetical protein